MCLFSVYKLLVSTVFDILKRADELNLTVSKFNIVFPCISFQQQIAGTQINIRSVNFLKVRQL